MQQNFKMYLICRVSSVFFPAARPRRPRPAKQIMLLLFLTLVQKLYAETIQISGKELGFYVRPEYNRAFHFCSDVQASGGIEFNNWITVKSGIALGNTGKEFDFKVFAGGEMAMPFFKSLAFGLVYRYNEIPGYETRSNSLLPLFSIKWQWLGFSIGPYLRFTSFFNEKPVFESGISFSVFASFIMKKALRLGLKFSNFNDFSAGNTGDYFINLNSVLRMGDHISLINEIELLQSGSIAMTANLYGIAYRGGVKFSW